VVLLTAGGDLTSAVDAVTHGALRYLLKPVPPGVLGDTVRDAVRLRRLAATKRQAFELYGSAAVKETLSAELGERFIRALETLWMAYEPIVRWSDRSVFAHEALVRNEEPTLKSPDALLAAVSFTELEPEVVKLDMSLIRSIDREPTKQKLTESMTRLCSDLGILVVGEGVETPVERDTLTALGCDLLQGYHLAKPGPAFPTPNTTP
jgi:EAL domain-containing protein (putative c-di-GMP-specific phosphodiesterase class I)